MKEKPKKKGSPRRRRETIFKMYFGSAVEKATYIKFMSRANKFSDNGDMCGPHISRYKERGVLKL